MYDSVWVYDPVDDQVERIETQIDGARPEVFVYQLLPTDRERTADDNLGRRDWNRTNDLCHVKATL